MASSDRNCLSYWFPPLRPAGLRVPDTEIITTEVELLHLLDGVTPEGFYAFVDELRTAVAKVGEPCFLRTGHGSGKHEWTDTCFVTSRERVDVNVARLVEWSALAHIAGLPTGVWAVRRLIPVAPLFMAFRGMPIGREFRVFIRGDEIEHVQPYWPPDAIENPHRSDWRERLDAASVLSHEDADQICFMAGAAAGAINDDGHWSVDLLQDAGGDWWLTDMADGDMSFRWDPA